jgi:hypothetical protein
MRDQRKDHQMSLPLKESRPESSSTRQIVRDDRSITDLSFVRSTRHANSVLDRVIREGYTKKK